MQRTEIALLAALLLAAAGAGDRPAEAGRVAAPRAAAAPAAPAADLPRFALFGWVSPPREHASAERYAELAEAGLNVTVLAWEDSGTVAANRARLEWTRPHGVRNLLLDMDLANVPPGDSAALAWADTVAARYRDDPAFLGYYLGDEPARAEFAEKAWYVALLRERDPAHPGWNNLLGRGAFPSREAWLEYTRAYVREVGPAVLCNDHYDFTVTGDRGLLVENVAGLAAIARENGLPFWGIVQLVEHGHLRDVPPALLRWQVAQWLAYGARGIGYFTYWTPPPDPQWNWQPAMIGWEGERTAKYDAVRDLNARLRPLGEALAGMLWLATEHAGSVPAGGTAFAPDSLLEAVEGRATIGTFADSAGVPHLFVANADSVAGHVLALLPAAGRRVWWRSDTGAWDALDTDADGRVRFWLGAGDFALLRLSGECDSLLAGRCALRLAVGPNPARGEVTFTLAGAAGTARLEVLDAAGRRVWAREVAGAGRLRWAGERDGGGRAAPGLYFARAEDARGVIVRRVSWLGAR